jgi:hypothetical protein
VQAALALYCDVFGFRISDEMCVLVNACFLHANPRHRSVALVPASVNRMDHVMAELHLLDGVGQAYGFLMTQRECAVATLGRQARNFMTSFYQRMRFDIHLEYGERSRS